MKDLDFNPSFLLYFIIISKIINLIKYNNKDKLKVNSS